MASRSRSLPPPAEVIAGTVDERTPAKRVQLAFASAAVLLAAADTYVVVLALTSIMADIGVSIDRLQEATPIVSGFLLGYVVVLPLLGRLSDLYGRQPVFVGCLAVFAAGSLVTAVAHSVAAVVAGRTIQGLGGGGLVPVTLALVADMWPPGRRGVPLGAIGAVQEFGSVLGPLYGAALIAVSGWRTIFWVNLPIAAGLAVAFALSRRGLPERRDRHGRFDAVGAALLGFALLAAILAVVSPSSLAASDTFGQLYSPAIGDSSASTPVAIAAMALALAFAAWELIAPRSVRPLVALRRLPAVLQAVDWVGAVLLGVALGCVILAFAAADPSTQVIASNSVVTLPLAALCIVAFAAWETRHPEPLVDLTMLRSLPASGALLVNLAVGGALMAALVDIPIFARATVDPDSQLLAALVLVRFLVAVPLGALVGGLLCERRIGYRGVAAVGMIVSAVTFIGMTRWDDTTLAHRWAIGGLTLPLGWPDTLLLLCGFGFGLVIAPVNAAVLGAVRSELHGIASALVVVARMIGMLVGLSLLTAIGLRRFFDAQSTIPSPIKLCPSTPGACPAYDHLEALAAIDELHAVFAGAAVCAALAALLAVGMLGRPRREAGERIGLAELLGGR